MASGGLKGIWSFLSRSRKDNWLRDLVDKGEVSIISPDLPFDRDYQVQPDAINLRLHPLAMRVKAGVSEIDLQAGLPGVREYFEECPISPKGLQLQPGELIFCRTLETVEIRSDKYIGLVMGRRNIAGFGLSIYCDQPKFAPGLAWNFPLQVQNRTNKLLKIYPFMYVAQLILIEYPSPGARSYRGNYRSYVENYVPLLDAEEQKRIDDAVNRTGGIKPAEMNTASKYERERSRLAELEQKKKEELSALIRKTGLSPVFSTLFAVSAEITAGLIVLRYFTQGITIPGRLIVITALMSLGSYVLKQISR